MKQLIMMIVLALSAMGCSASGSAGTKTAADLKAENRKLRQQSIRQQSELNRLNLAQAQKSKAATDAPSSQPTPAPQASAATPFIATPVMTSVIPGFYGGTVGPAVGYLDRDPMDGRDCGGMCVALKSNHYAMHVIVDSREMAQVFGGSTPLYPLANKALPGGGRQLMQIPLVPPGRAVKFVMDANGLRQLTVVFYNKIPGNPVAQPVGVWRETMPFPYREGLRHFKWGAVRDDVRPNLDISRY